MQPAAKRGLLIFVVGVLLIAGALAFTYWRQQQGGFSLSEQIAPVAIGGDFTLTDQNGKVRHAADFQGKLMLVYFGYTYCPDACPTALQDISQAIDQLGEKGDGVTPIFITVDPDRDTPKQMKLYAENFHPRLVALTGSKEEIAAAARAYRVYYQKEKPSKPGADDYLMDHTGYIYLMGRDGRYISHFAPGVTPAEMAKAIAAHL